MVEASLVNALRERIEAREGGARVRATGTPVTEVLGRLERGEAPARVIEALGLTAPDLLAAIAHDALDNDGPPLVQSVPKRSGLAPALGAPALAELFPRMTRPDRLTLAAGLLQVADFWHASHQAAQEADDLGERAHSAYWHGIAHRREPDPGNAAYWFRRVGRHPLFPELALAARPLIEAAAPDLVPRLLPRGGWDPFAFIELCASARGPAATLARALQRVEMIFLLGALVPA